MLARLPAELIDLVLLFTSSAADLSHVGATCSLLRLHTSRTRLWEAVVAAKGYPRVLQGLSPKEVAILCEKTRCDRCGRRASALSSPCWPTLEKLCSRGHGRNSAPTSNHPALLLPDFSKWVQSQYLVDFAAADARTAAALQVKTTKRDQIVARFAALPNSPISQATAHILNLCPSFKRIYSSKPLVSERVFQNTRATLEPEIVRVRIELLANEKFANICASAFPTATSWSPAFYLFNRYNGYLKEVGVILVNRYLHEFSGMKWNDTFPDTDMTTHINEAKRSLVLPFQNFQTCKQSVLNQHPVVSNMMILFQAQQITAIKELFTETLALTSQERLTKFETLFGEFVTIYRLLKLFPGCQAHFVVPHQSVNPNQQRLAVNQNGVIAWYLQNPSYFHFKNPVWYRNYNVIETEAHTWIRSIYASFT
ncbi:UNVERIFIED_CONTAM: hypothetical protein HDU68_005539 [Siphonaria sp. JEL0065]|nr:hypothetical protein HDU68_005539 [Siphonaria sp. JEL0065]